MALLELTAILRPTHGSKRLRIKMQARQHRDMLFARAHCLWDMLRLHLGKWATLLKLHPNAHLRGHTAGAVWQGELGEARWAEHSRSEGSTRNPCDSPVLRPCGSRTQLRKRLTGTDKWLNLSMAGQVRSVEGTHSCTERKTPSRENPDELKVARQHSAITGSHTSSCTILKWWYETRL